MPSCTPTNQLRAATLLLAAFASSAQAETGAAGLEFFENRIRPVFAEHCHECHSATAKKVRGDLKLDTREGFLKGGTDGAIVVPGEPEKSRLIHAVRYEDEDTRMPPKKDGRKKLPDVAIADLVAWVKMGAPYPETSAAVLAKNKAARPWAFDPVRNPPPPAVKNTAWPATSIDPFILAKLEERGLQPSPPADPRTLIRRATYDLTGLPPTPEEVEAFAESYGTLGTERTHRSNESHPAYRSLVDKLLASPRYGERWGRHWLDVVRYADTAGDTADYPVGLAWRYRNYVIDAFNADKPYDEFLREQIAGDVIAEQGPRERYAERLTATGFLAISRRFGFDSEKYQHLMIQDTIDTLGQTVLGLSLGCARCHDHKFDPISMRDYYALYGIFDSTRYPFPGSEQKNKSRSMVPLAPPAEAQPMWREYEQLVAARLAAKKQGAPPVVLRSLHDPDGDFEMQKDAAGGSYGVIVAPWMWEGKLSVTGPAQSPFKNLYPFGSFGVNIAGGDSDYRLAQSLHPRRTAEKNRVLHVNLDFRPAAPGAKGLHRFWLGAQAGAPAVELFISAEAVFVRAGEKMESVAALKPNTWHNLQLTLDLGNRTFGGTVGRTDDATAFSGKTFTAGWPGVIDYVALDSTAREGAALPGLELDNFGMQPEPIAPASTAPPVPSASAEVERDLNSLLEDGPCEMTYGVVEGTPHHARMQLRGEPDRPGDEVPRGFISSLGGGPLQPGTQGSGRLELAQWLTRPDNPLAARVMVNRIWQYHFGRGLVMTSNDFGTRGQAATHPELLDHLATKFVQGGWSVKGMHRAIMLSAAYRQGSIVPEQNAAALAEHYSAFPRRRISAEEMRDSILAISGELDLTPARGHPFPSPLKSAFTQHTPFSAVYDHNKRSVYLMTQRIKRHPFLALFDGPDPNASTADRRNTTVPTQALYFLNAPFVHEKARKCAALLLAARTDEAQRIELAWLLTTGRPPTGAEQSEAAAFLAAYRAELAASGEKEIEPAALAAYVRTLFGSNEFLHVD